MCFAFSAFNIFVKLGWVGFQYFCEGRWSWCSSSSSCQVWKYVCSQNHLQIFTKYPFMMFQIKRNLWFVIIKRTEIKLQLLICRFKEEHQANLINKLAKLRRHASRIHFAKRHFGYIHFGKYTLKNTLWKNWLLVKDTLWENIHQVQMCKSAK